MPGDRWQRFANLRAYFAFMWTHPGKKLLFMGGEFGQEREWNHDSSLDWRSLADPFHAGVQALVRDLNRLYRATPALYRLDCEPEGFAWIDAANGAESVLSYLRRGRERARAGRYRRAISPRCRATTTASACRARAATASASTPMRRSMAAAASATPVRIDAEPHPMHGHAYSLRLNLPPLGVLIFTLEP